MKPTRGGNGDDGLEAALKEAWDEIDGSYPAEPASPEQWIVFVKDSKALAKKRLWRELALFWAIAAALLSGLLVLSLELPAWFWYAQCAVAVAGIALLVGEFRQSAGSGGVARERKS